MVYVFIYLFIFIFEGNETCINHYKSLYGWIYYHPQYEQFAQVWPWQLFPICITVPKVSKYSPTTLSPLLFRLLIGISSARCHPPIIIQNDWLNLVLNFKPTIFQVSLGTTSNFLLVKPHFFWLKSHASPFLVPNSHRRIVLFLILSTKLPAREQSKVLGGLCTASSVMLDQPTSPTTKEAHGNP